MDGKVTTLGATLNLILVGGYALLAKTTSNEKIGLAALAIFQSSQFYAKERFPEKKLEVQIAYDIIPFATFAYLKAHVVATIGMGLLFAHTSRFAEAQSEEKPREDNDTLPIPPKVEEPDAEEELGILPLNLSHGLTEYRENFYERREHGFFPLDGPAEQFEYITKTVAVEAHELSKQYIPRYSHLCDWSSTQVERSLIYLSDQTLTLANHPKACDQLEYLQALSKKVELVVVKVCPYDPTEFSSALVLFLQDRYDNAAIGLPALKARRAVKQWIDDFPETVTRKIYSYSNRTPTPFSKISTPVITTSLEMVLPKEDFHAWFGKVSKMAHTTIDSVESAGTHALVYEGALETAPKVTGYALRRICKGFLCWGTVQILTGSINLLHSTIMTPQDDEEVDEVTPLITSTFCLTGLLVAWMINREVYEWKKEREKSHRPLKDRIAEEEAKVRGGMEGLKKEKGYIEEICSDCFREITDSFKHDPIEHTPPPEHTVFWPAWEASKSYLWSGWESSKTYAWYALERASSCFRRARPNIEEIE